MPVTPSNCYICRSTWTGTGPICDVCLGHINQPPSQSPICSFCGGAHDSAACLAAAVARTGMTANIFYQYYMASMASRSRTRHNPFTYNWNKNPVLKFCPKCKGNYLIESKAGSVCSSCKTVVHNPCRNCDSTNTKGLQAPTENAVFIECQDCLFIE